MSWRYAAIGGTLAFGFVSNDTSGSADDGATPLFDVRLVGAAASAAPVLSGTPDLLTHANYGPGCHEVSIAATTGNGFAAGSSYLVFVTITADSQTPGACIGGFTLAPVDANIIEVADAAVSTSTAQLGVNVVNAGGTAWGSGAITAASIAANAIADTKIASNAITAAKIATDAITAAKIAADAIGASELAADAATEIADAVLSRSAAAHTTNGTLGAIVNDLEDAGRLDALIDAILDDTGTSGVVVASVGAGAIANTSFASGAIDADALAADAIAEIWETAISESYQTTITANHTGAQLLYQIWSFLQDTGYSGTTKTSRKLDGATTSMTHTLDDGTSPTDVTRAT